MEERDNRRPATPEQIESMNSNFKLTMESSYHELYVDMVLHEALKRGNLDEIEGLDKDYAGMVLDVYANVCYVNFCLFAQMRSSLKAPLGVEKRYDIRRSVVTAHEIYKNLYGFNGAKTPWKDIEKRLQEIYPEQCHEIDEAAEAYRVMYAGNGDMDTRNVAKHFSSDPEEFYNRMAEINERSVMDRILALMKFLQPIHTLLVEELRRNLGMYYLVGLSMPMPEQRFETVGMVEGEDLETFKKGIVHYDSIVSGLFRQIAAIRRFSDERNMDVEQIPEWAFMVKNNMVAHILYIYIDLTTTFLAFTRSETFAEYQLNLAYLFLSAHEGFKKLYGFDERGRAKSYWTRSVKSEMEKLDDESLLNEVAQIEGRLEILSQSEYLKDEDKAAVFSDIETNKKAKKENAILVLDYFRSVTTADNLNDLRGFLFLMNDIVRLVNKVLEAQSAESSRRLHEKFVNFRQVFDKIEAMIAENVKDAAQTDEYNETTKKFRAFIDDMESKLLGNKKVAMK